RADQAAVRGSPRRGRQGRHRPRPGAPRAGLLGSSFLARGGALERAGDRRKPDHRLGRQCRVPYRRAKGLIARCFPCRQYRRESSGASMNRLASPAQLRASFVRWALFLVPLVVLLGLASSLISGSTAESPWFATLEKP